MTEEDRKKFTKLMYLFSNNKNLCLTSKIKEKFTEELFDEAVEKKYIKEVESKDNCRYFRITEEGKNFW